MAKKRITNEAEDLLYSAQKLMFEAFEAPTNTKARKLAEQALLLSPDCADAYTMLADLSRSKTDRLALLLAGVAAGERGIGPKDYKEMMGSFWGFIETRPYMRALLQLALCYEEMFQYEHALKCYMKMLELNTNDNQGVRDLAMPLLIVLKRYEDAEKLYDTYKNDSLATWAYSRVLLDYIKYGNDKAAEKNLEKALERNIYVAHALTGGKRPQNDKGAYSPRSPEEAHEYLRFNERAWRLTDGAIAWLKNVVKKKLP